MTKKIGFVAVIVLSILYPTRSEIIHAEIDLRPPSHAQTSVSATLNSIPVVQITSINPVKVRRVKVTAYTSSPEETDDTPFITASGKTVRDGIVASNFLPLGTKIQIPSIYGRKIFVVEDRMHPRMTNVVDVWMENKEDAIKFGSRHAEIAILD